MVLPRVTAVMAGLLALGVCTAAARADGTTRVEESDGTVRVYRHVTIRVVDHRGVRITSADGKGTLFVSKGACSFAGELERCLPYRIVLEQGGASHPIDFERGTEYVNRTASPQALPRSSERVPAHGIMLFMVTARGTHVTVRGTIDRMSA